MKIWMRVYRNRGMTAGCFGGRRGFTARGYLWGAAASVVILGGVGGALYYRANSPSALGQKAEIALEQHDNIRAIDFLQRALGKNPTGDLGVNLRVLMAKALIGADREVDARPYLQEALTEKPGDGAVLDLMVETHVHIAYRKLKQSPMPLAATSIGDILGTVSAELGDLGKMAQDGRTLIGEARLHRLAYMIREDQYQRATGRLAAAKLAGDAVATDKAQREIAALGDLGKERAEVTGLLKGALKVDPKNEKAGEYLVQYAYLDHDYKEGLAEYEALKASGVNSPEMAISGANIMISDTARQPVRKERYAEAERELEGYLKDHPKESPAPAPTHVLVAIGDTLIEQGKISEADAMAQRATAQSPTDLDAQILLINTKLSEKKNAEALALARPLATSNGSIPQIWFLLGQADRAVGDLHSAETDFKQALVLDATYTAARRALMGVELKSGNHDAAVLLAAQENKDDPYFIPAWGVTAEDLQKHGLGEKARGMLAGLAADPQLPMESRGDVVELLLQYGLADVAQKLYATLPAGGEDAQRLAPELAQAENRLADARGLMAKQVAASPGDFDLRLRYAELLLRSGLAPDARAQLDAVAAMKGKAALGAGDWVRVARGYLYLRMPTEALAAAKEALGMEPKNGDAQNVEGEATAMLTGVPAGPGPVAGAGGENATVGETIQAAGAALAKKDYAGTLTLVRAGLAKDGGNVALHLLNARALAGLGQTDKAVVEVTTAASAQPGSPAAFETFVDMFTTTEEARGGLRYVTALTAINPALGNWAVGRLAEAAGDPSGAMTYYRTGLANTSRTMDPGAAKQALFQAVLALDASQDDVKGLEKDADDFAGEPAYGVGIRLVAADHLRLMGDSAEAAGELEKAGAALGAGGGQASGHVVGVTAQMWAQIGRPEKATALLEKYVGNGAADGGANGGGAGRDPQLTELYAGLLEKSDPGKALRVREELAGTDPTNPRYQVGLAQSELAAGDEAGAFKTLEGMSKMGQTGKELARTARLRMLISLGLLKEAAAELGGDSAGANDYGRVGGDYASMLAIGQGWINVGDPAKARASLAGIPSYAAEYPAAVADLALVDSMAGKFEAAIGALEEKGGGHLNGELFQTYVRAGKDAEALELAEKMLNLYPKNSAAWRTWTINAATAARESKKYGEGEAFLQALDPEARKGAALDIAYFQLMEKKFGEAGKTAGELTDAFPTYDRSTILLLAKAEGDVKVDRTVLLSKGPASTVYAYLAAHYPASWGEGVVSGKIPAEWAVGKNGRVFAGDIEALLKELGGKGAEPLRELALVQRLVEANWDTSALGLLDEMDKGGPGGGGTMTGMLLRQRADTDLKKTAAADAIVEAVAAKVKGGAAVPPSARILLAAAAAKKGDYAGAVAALEPLEALKRADVMTTMATFYEDMGQLDKAVELNRAVRKMDPGNIHAANNLAYTLAAAHPGDKASLAEAKAAAEFAVGKAPKEAVFQDTLAWVEILSGDAAGGAKRLVTWLPELRLAPAAHYHLGTAYARMGLKDLAKLHLENVGALAGKKGGAEVGEAERELGKL